MQARYEGILSEVDTIAKTMRLKNVKNCGTEGRRGGGSNEIQPSEQEIQEVLFKIEHIKDFKILEKPNPILIDDAIISTSTQLTNTEEKKAPESQKK
jgi:protein LSM14